MTTRSKTSNARNRVPTATRAKVEALDAAQKDTLAQLATALERIGVLELCLWGGGPRTAQDVIAKQAEAEERNRVFEEQFRAAGGTVVYGPDDSHSAHERYLAEACASAAVAAINDIKFPSAAEISRSITGLSPRRAPFWRRALPSALTVAIGYAIAASVLLLIVLALALALGSG